MKNTKRSITFKVVAGYFLLVVLAVFAVWFIYGQIVAISESTEEGNLNNRKLFLVSEATTNLYVAEGISRDIIQNQKAGELPRFRQQIDTITVIIDSLKILSPELKMNVELDSIKELLQFKNKNLEELLILRKEATTESYYAKVINRLQRIDDTFEEENYEEQLSDLNPTARRAIIGLIEFSKENREKELTQKTSDSLVNSLKRVLNNLEIQERRIMFSINQKEYEILENDRIISNQLRDLRAAIEKDEIQKSINQVSESRELLERTSVIIGGVGVLSVLTIFTFGVLIFKDTNKSQKYRQQLEASKNYTESLLKSREQIMAAVTHDLRSPLNTVIGYSDLLNKSELSEKQKHYLNNLRTSSDYILRLVNDLLDLSKLEAGKIHIEEMRFNLRGIIHESVKNAIHGHSHKNISLHIYIDEKLEPEIISDPFRLQQILTNLISNAYKFTEEGEIRIRAELKKIKKNPQMLSIKVSDTGIGISKAHQKIVFDEFSQADKDIEKLYGGYGLGLAITKKLVTLLNGGIYVESQLGKGSAFAFYIPITFPEGANTQIVDKFEEEYKSPATLQTILIVDDEPSQLALTEELLKKTGVQTETAQNGLEAWEKIKNKKFDMVLTDIQMPGLDGFGLLEKIKQNSGDSAPVVIALSGNTEITEESFKKLGFAKKVTKPYRPEELLNIIFNKNKSDLPSSENIQKNNEPFDLSDLYLFTQGDPDSLSAVLNSFIENTYLNLREMEHAFEINDSERISLLAHKMLPMFRQLKIKKGIPYLEELEEMNDNIEILKLSFSDFNTQVSDILNELQKTIKS